MTFSCTACSSVIRTNSATCCLNSKYQVEMQSIFILSISQTIQCRMVGWEWIVIWKGFRRKMSKPNWGTIPIFTWSDWEKPRNTSAGKCSCRHSNRASLESYRYTNLLLEGRSSLYCSQYGDYALVLTTFIFVAHCLVKLSYFIRKDKLAVTYHVTSTSFWINWRLPLSFFEHHIAWAKPSSNILVTNTSNTNNNLTNCR
jgi:hypothetical protein